MATTQNEFAFLRINDEVEDRSMMTGYGHVVYLKGNTAIIRFHDGSEEEVDVDLFVHHEDRRWII